jgi:PAS domain S-box-containing protein
MSETARRADALVENMADAVLILDRDGTLLWSQLSQHELGLDPQQLPGEFAAQSLHDPDAGRFRAALAEAVANPGRRIRADSLHLVTARDAGRSADVTITSLPDTPGINGVLVVIHINEQPRSPGQNPSQEQLRQVVRLSQIGVFDHDHVANEMYWSPEHRRICGWGPTEPVELFSRDGKLDNVADLIHPVDWERVVTEVKRAHSGEGDGRFDMEYRIIRRDGALRWVMIRSQTFFEGTGAGRHPVRTVGAVEDITARKNAERQIGLMQTSVDRCSTAIYWVNSRAQITYANDRACQSLGLTRKELIGLRVWDIDPNFTPDRWHPLWEQVKRDKSIVVQTQHRRKDGTLFPIEALGTYLQLDEEEIVFVFAQDATERERAERQLRMLHAAIDKSHTPFFSITPSGEIVYANEHACRTLGFAPQELIGKHTWDIDPSVPADKPEMWNAVRHSGHLRIETSHRHKDGTLIPVEVTANYFSYKEEEFALAFAQDITERKQTEIALRTSEERLRQVALVYDIGMFEHDIVTNRFYWSPELRKYWGIGPEDPVQGSFLWDVTHPEDRDAVKEARRRARDPQGDGRYSLQHRLIRPDGSVRWVDMRARTFFEGVGDQRRPVRTVGALVDITERRKAVEALRDSLREKEILLREVHHRVKNNLQIIASLLHFQAKQVKHPDDLAAFADGRNRLRSMILVHEKLYQSPDLSRVDLGNYLRALVRDLHHSYLSSGGSLDIRVAIEPLALPIESALPCGMIVCELLTNVFKYAFPEGRRGTVTVSLGASNGLIRLSVQDDGIGLPATFDANAGASFGWQLIRNLISQLGGTANVARRDGTHVEVTFPRPTASLQ